MTRPICGKIRQSLDLIIQSKALPPRDSPTLDVQPYLNGMQPETWFPLKSNDAQSVCCTLARGHVNSLDCFQPAKAVAKSPIVLFGLSVIETRINHKSFTLNSIHPLASPLPAPALALLLELWSLHCRLAFPATSVCKVSRFESFRAYVTQVGICQC